MKRMLMPLAALLALGSPMSSGVVRGQEVPAGVADPSTALAPTLCVQRDPEEDAFLAQVDRAMTLEPEEAAIAALDGLEPEARRISETSPNDAAAQYRLAAVMGARLEHESGRTKMADAAKVRAQAERVLALEPDHPGASYMLGRIHASILRMSGLKRFLAKQLFGGDALEGASWEKAQALLEVAAREDPCVPEHHFELGRVYAARGDSASAAREFASVLELTAGRDGRDARLRERAEDLGRKL